MSQQKHIIFTWIYCLKNWVGGGITLQSHTFWTCSVQVFLWELKLVKRGYLKCRLILCSGKYSACPVNAISFNDPKTQYLNQMINDEMFAFWYFLLNWLSFQWYYTPLLLQWNILICVDKFAMNSCNIPVYDLVQHDWWEYLWHQSYLRHYIHC